MPLLTFVLPCILVFFCVVVESKKCGSVTKHCTKCNTDCQIIWMPDGLLWKGCPKAKHRFIPLVWVLVFGKFLEGQVLKWYQIAFSRHSYSCSPYVRFGNTWKYRVCIPICLSCLLTTSPETDLKVWTGYVSLRACLKKLLPNYQWVQELVCLLCL